MECLECGTENPDSANFCNDCGARMYFLCPFCGASNPREGTICPHCNHKLCKPEKTIPIDFRSPHSYTPKHLADLILRSKCTIEGERKVVTVMFADAKGFTSISEALDPEDVHRIMSGCFSILLDEIHKVQGTVNDFRGDGLMALFGAPIAHEDHAQRACYACLAIQKGLAEYGEQVRKTCGMDFKMRIGLNSGPVVVGVIGDDLRMDYSAQGDTANLAARMETNAEPGTVLVSENTYRLARYSFEFQPLGSLRVKGRQKPVAVYRLQKRAYKAKARSEREIYSEMVGRDRELQRLETNIHKVVNGEGSVVNVIGEAGIGKSRLLAELKKSDVVERVTLLEGRAISMGKTLAFHPIVDLLKQWSGIGEADSEAEALDKLETAVRWVCPEEADEITPFVGTLMGMKLTGPHAERVKGIEGEGLEKLIFKNLRELLIKGAQLRPTVVVMEDLHWADASSIELLDRLYPVVEKHRIAFINVFRPGYFDGNEAKIASIGVRLPRHYVELAVRPLDQTHSETLIDKMLAVERFPHHVKRQIVERAGGNPFFIEEVMRSLIDQGAVARRNGGFEVTETIERVVIPPTINDVLMARIDRLEERTRELVKVASVIGRSFFERILKDVADSIDDLDNRLAYLKDVQLIRDRIRMQELEYLFKHALAQEAVYESTLLRQRKMLHLKVAQSVEKIFPDRLQEFYGMLAYHYSKGEHLEKAEEYMQKAGEEALRSSASGEALYYFREALKMCLEKWGDSVDLEKAELYEKNIALAYFYRGQHADALEYFDRALRRWNRQSSQYKIVRALRGIYDMIIVFGHVYLPSNKDRKVPSNQENELFDLWFKKMQALAWTEPGQISTEYPAILRKSLGFEVKRINVGAEMWIGFSTYFVILIQAHSLAKKILEYSERFISPDRINDRIVHAFAVTVHKHCSGRWQEMPEFDHHLVNSSVRSGQVWFVDSYVWTYIGVRVEQGAFQEAECLIDQFGKIADDYQYGTSLAHARMLKAAISIKKGMLQTAHMEVDAGLAVAIECGLEMDQILLLGQKTLVKALEDHPEAARELVLEAKGVIANQLYVAPLWVSTHLLGAFAVDLKLLEAAMEKNDTQKLTGLSRNIVLSSEAALANAWKYAPYRTWILKLMGDYCWLVGKKRKAFKWWAKAIQEGERLGARPDLSRTYFEVGKRLLEPQSKYKHLNGTDAKGYLEKAEALFEEMALERDLEELARVRERT